MNAQHWIRYFQENRHAFDEPDWSSHVLADSPLADDPRLPLLIRSLATFQLGESGGGSRLLRFVERETRADSDYLSAMHLFVAEEQRHAELLAHVVRYLDGELLTHHWMNGIFRRARSLVNLEFNVQVLLTAELIAEAYYGFLHRYVDDPVIHRITGKILADEVRHIAFHSEFFRHRNRQRLPVAGGIWSLQFQAIFVTAEHAVWADHGKFLRSFGVDRRQFRATARNCCRRFLEAVMAPAPSRRHQDNHHRQPRIADLPLPGESA